MDQYLPGIQAVLLGKVSPVEAIRAIEAPEIHAHPALGTQSEAQPVEKLQDSDRPSVLKA